MAAVVAGPRVSISATIPPAALSRVISPTRPDWLVTVNVWVPARADVHSRAHPLLVTVTAVMALALAAGRAAITLPAATTGTATSAPATVQVRCPASRSQRATALLASGAGAVGAGAAPARPARMNKGMTTARYVTQATACRTVIFGVRSVIPVSSETHHELGSTCVVRSNRTQCCPGSRAASCRSPRPADRTPAAITISATAVRLKNTPTFSRTARRYSSQHSAAAAARPRPAPASGAAVDPDARTAAHRNSALDLAAQLRGQPGGGAAHPEHHRGDQPDGQHAQQAGRRLLH